MNNSQASADKGNEAAPSLRAKVAAAEEHVQAARQAQGEVSLRILDQRKSIRKKEKEAEKVQPDVDAVEQKAVHSRQKIKNAEDIVTAIQADLNKYARACEQYRRDYDNAKEAADQAAAEHARISSKRGLVLSEADLQRYHELRGEANRRAATERQKLEALLRDVRAKQNRMQAVQDKLSASESQREKLATEDTSLNAQASNTEDRRREVQEQLRASRREDEASKTKRDGINRRMESINATLEDCLKKLAEAGSMQRESEKEAKTKETIAALRRMYPGVHGRLVDLCRPTQRKYDVAVSTVLGKNAEAIVVDTQREAIECIEFLKRQRAGQATFVPLEIAQVKEVNDRLRSAAPGARLALDILEYSPGLEKAIRYACGNAMVCDDMSIARHICYEKKHEVKGKY